MAKQTIQVLGDGSFGSFLKSFLTPEFNVINCSERDHSENNKQDCPIILAVPLSALREVAQHYKNRLIINVCSVQEPSNNILIDINANFIGIHPLFGARTPPAFRNAIITHSVLSVEGKNFVESFERLCVKVTPMTDRAHDAIMADTHLKAIALARTLKGTLGDYPDHLIPHSYRLLKNLIDTLNDTPNGTIETILANKYR